MHSHATLANGYHDQTRSSEPWMSGQSLPLYANGQPVSKFADLQSAFARLKNKVVRPLQRAPSPSSLKFIFMCSLWYTSSALSSNTGKAILNQFRYPVTLTFVQFGFIALYCLLFMSPAIRFSHLRPPTRAILKSTIPMGMFQVGGHVFSSMAMSTIPVSTVHTIKALSPLFTVAAYALLFGVSYSSKTYMSLLPLTIGVMLACSFDMSASNYIGLLCAFGSALVFVSSNIFFKKIMPSGATQSTSKLDKLNLLFYSASVAFVLMIPIWMWSDLPALLGHSEHVVHPSHSHNHSYASVAYYFFMNGTVHFAQNIIAFVILSSTSPVTYSIASLIKRVVVICIAISFGIAMTFTGLYMYNNAKSDVERGEKKMRRVEAAKDMMLPMTTEESVMMSGTDGETTGTVASRMGRSRAASIPHLMVKITPPILSSKLSPIKAVSPTDSYPSPPPSIDSRRRMWQPFP
ncbi:TPT-domain-containing protein [Hymenopellis radicata]|nr:TPT-domain-containing protein [Hymenopellis radicata]